MGACDFIQSGVGETPKEAFMVLYEEANYMHGQDSYNGSISTCHMGRCTLKFDKWNKTNEKKAYNHIEKEGNGVKWEARYVDLGTVGYKVYTAKSKTMKSESPKYKMKYVLKISNLRGSEEKTFETKGEAEAYGIKMAMENPNMVFEVFKKYVLVGGVDKVSEIEIEEKTYKTKPNLKPMTNRRIIEMRKYLFYGWASC